MGRTRFGTPTGSRLTNAWASLGADVPLVANTPTNILGVDLTPGVWQLSAGLTFLAAGAGDGAEIYLSPDGVVFYASTNVEVVDAGRQGSAAIPAFPVRLFFPTTMYLGVEATGADTVKAQTLAGRTNATRLAAVRIADA